MATKPMNMEYEGKCCGTCKWCRVDEKYESPHCVEPRIAGKSYPSKAWLWTLIGRCPEGYWMAKEVQNEQG